MSGETAVNEWAYRAAVKAGLPTRVKALSAPKGRTDATVKYIPSWAAEALDAATEIGEADNLPKSRRAYLQALARLPDDEARRAAIAVVRLADNPRDALDVFFAAHGVLEQP